MEVSFESPDLVQLRGALERYARRGVPHAARNALSAAAFEGRRIWIDQVQQSMTLRNTWTVRSIRVQKARGTRMESLVATLGSVAPYMATQEFGDTETKRGHFGVPIPTPRASGEPRGAKPRRRRVRRPNRLARIQLRPRPGRTPKQRNAIAIAMALRSRRRYVFLNLERRQGIFRLMGGRRRPRIEMIWDLSQTSVRIPATSTLQRSLDLVLPRVPSIAARALLQQLARARVPGYTSPLLGVPFR